MRNFELLLNSGKKKSKIGTEDLTEGYQAENGLIKIPSPFSVEDYRFSVGVNELISTDNSTFITTCGTNRQDDYHFVHVFGKEDGLWTETKRIGKPSEVPNLVDFGRSATLTKDGNTVAALGTIEVEQGAGEFRPIILVFDLINNEWVFRNKAETITEESLGSYGSNIIFSPDGKKLFVSSSQYEGFGYRKGGVFLYEEINNEWVEQDIIYPSDRNLGSSPYFGSHMAMSDDGESLIISAYNCDCMPDNPNTRGASFLYQKENGVWTEQHMFLPSDIANDPSKDIGAWFGHNVDLNYNGTRAFVGFANRDLVTASGTKSMVGGIYVYEKTQSGWVETDILIPDVAESYSFIGYACSCSSDGKKLLTGSLGKYVNIFEEINGVWSNTENYFPIDGSLNDDFGIPTVLSDDGTLGLISAGRDDEAALDAGAVYVYEAP